VNGPDEREVLAQEESPTISAGALFPPRRNRTRAVFVLLTMTAIGFLLFHAGDDLLAVQDNLSPTRTAVVLGGDAKFRGKEAARLYNLGYAREIWLTAREEDDNSRDPFERMGIPRSAVHVFDWHEANTASELRAVACQLQASETDTVILVTSTYHTRRVKLLWRKLTGDHPHAIVRYTTEDVSDTKHWWRTSYGARSVWHEWIGLLGASAAPSRWL
jgi:uncharacterized SAM-binding protein YcdF (DUF218 family)